MATHFVFKNLFKGNNIAVGTKITSYTYKKTP